MKLFKFNNPLQNRKKSNPQEENWEYIVNKKDFEKAADRDYRKNRRKDLIRATIWKLSKVAITLAIIYGLIMFSFQIPIIGPTIKSWFSNYAK